MGVTLTIVGLVLSMIVWRRRGPAAGLRGVAWSLLPAAAGLTGTLRLIWDIGDSVVNWATRLVFSPVVWAGIVLAGVSVVLFGVSGAMRARGAGGASKTESSRSSRSPKTTKADKSAARQVSATRSAPAAKGDDIEGMDDIEAILRKHGIQ
jgi:hypothetical protein